MWCVRVGPRPNEHDKSCKAASPCPKASASPPWITCFPSRSKALLLLLPHLQVMHDTHKLIPLLSHPSTLPTHRRSIPLFFSTTMKFLTFATIVGTASAFLAPAPMHTRTQGRVSTISWLVFDDILSKRV